MRHFITILTIAVFLFPQSAFATRKLAKKPVRTLKNDQCPPWQRIECWEDKHRIFREEKFNKYTAHPAKMYFGKGIVKAFGSRTPHSQYFLLHYGKNWDKLKKTPVLLVHGASSDATRSFGSTFFGGEKALMFRLVKAGFPVFAITFPNPQGNLYYQAEHIGNAVKVIKMRTGKKKINIVCHSAGGISTRMYLTNVRYRWGTRYRKDVDKVVFIAVPHRGLDFVFRHPISFIRFHEYGMPSGWTWHKTMPDVVEKSIFSGCYAMQLMILNDLSKEVPLGKGEIDWYTTFYGGKGHVSKGPGIKKAMAMGGHHMKKVMSARFHRKMEVYLLAGTKKRLKYHDLQGKIQEEEGEYDGESDGICFLISAMATKHLRRQGANIKGTKVLPLNHVELLFLDSSVNWIIKQLDKK